MRGATLNARIEGVSLDGFCISRADVHSARALHGLVVIWRNAWHWCKTLAGFGC